MTASQHKNKNLMQSTAQKSDETFQITNDLIILELHSSQVKSLRVPK